MNEYIVPAREHGLVSLRTVPALRLLYLARRLADI